MSSQGQPTPPSSHSSNNGASPDGHNFRVVRKRNRVPLSCAPCRHRKLKCNRGHPCDNCTKRGDIASCNYATPGTRKRGSTAGPNATPDDMQNRIDRLEGLVLSLMTSGQEGPAATASARAAIHASRSESVSTGSDAKIDTPPIEMIAEEHEGDESELDNISRGIGIMKVDGAKTIFASDAHWYAILGEISEVKKYFEGHKDDYARQMAKVQAAKGNANLGGVSLFQGLPALTKDELLAAYPPKADADRLIARYFNAYDPSVHIIHGPSFQEQYNRHWLNPAESSVAWLGLNFAMMTLALQSYGRAGDEPPEYHGRTIELAHEYRRLTAQSLVLADLTMPIAHLLETMVLHVQAEFGRSKDAEPGVLLLVSLCVRLAMRMGYHRDPGHYPGITPFQGEMRRRLWCYIRSSDSIISFQFGMPATIRHDHTDTELPRSLYDDELHADMKVLPPSRQSFEATPMLYMITKAKMTWLFGRIGDRSQSILNPLTYEEVMAMDQELRDLRAQHPPLLCMRSFHESARDPANIIMQRLGLEMMFLRCLFVLHRRFISRGRENPRYAFSRRVCLDSSLELLRHQATLHEESQPGGRLRSVKWHISSLSTHDFLLAAMLICSDLHHTAELERLGRKPSSPSAYSPGTPADPYDSGKRKEMLQAVEHCIGIWDSVRDQSMEAYKGSLALRVMVEKIKLHQERQRQAMQISPASNSGPYPLITASNDNAGNSHPGNYLGQTPNTNLGMFPNGSINMTNVKMDDLPPEQSAAMTLGLLSSGGVSPGASFGLGSGSLQNQPHGSNTAPNAPASTAVGGETRSPYPASMAALLSESNSGEQQRSGLSPGYSTSADPNAAPSGGLSPLSQMFAQSGAGANMVGFDGMGGDIDWTAWDSYIQGTGATTLDASQMWPMNLDLAMDGMQMPSTPGGGPAPSGTGGVFMGAPGAG